MTKCYAMCIKIGSSLMIISIYQCIKKYSPNSNSEQHIYEQIHVSPHPFLKQSLCTSQRLHKSDRFNSNPFNRYRSFLISPVDGVLSRTVRNSIGNFSRRELYRLLGLFCRRSLDCSNYTFAHKNLRDFHKIVCSARPLSRRRS